MAHTLQSSEIPGRVINLDQARIRHGHRADHMVRMLAVGDPLADAVIVETDALGKEGRGILNAGLADGLERLTERPPAIADVERYPAFSEADLQSLSYGNAGRLYPALKARIEQSSEHQRLW